MTTWTTADVVKEVSELSELLRLRAQASPQENRGVGIGKPLAESIASKIRNADGLDAGELYKAIGAGASLAELKEVLLGAVDAAVQKPLGGRSHANSSLKLAKQPQVLLSLQNYCTATDWKVLEAGVHWNSVHCVAQRLRAVGLQSLQEQTKKHAACVIAHVVWQSTQRMMSSTDLYQLCQDVHHAFTNTRSGFPADPPTQVLRFPLTPQELGAEYVAAAYPQEQPEPRVLQSLPRVAAACPVRETSKLLRAEKGAPVQTQAHATLQPNSAPEPLLLMAKSMAAFMQQLGMAGASQEPSIHLRTAGKQVQAHAAGSSCWQSPSPAGPLALCLPAPAAPAPSAPAASAPAASAPAAAPALTQQDIAGEPSKAALPEHAHEPQKAEENSLQAMEEQAFQQLAKRRQGMKKRPAAAPSASESAPSKKGPGAAKAAAAKPAVKEAKAGAAKSAASKPAKAKAGALKLGCKRCRGSRNGCETCLSADFCGERLNRAEWRAWAGV